MREPNEVPVFESSALQVFDRALGRFLPASLAGHAEAHRRARLVVASSLVLMIIDVLVLFMIRWTPLEPMWGLWMPRPVVSAVLLAACAHLATAFLVRRTGRADHGAFVLISTLVAVFTSLALQSGGFESPMVWWLAALPMYSAFLAGPRGTVTTSLVVVLIVFGFYLFDSSTRAPELLAGEVPPADILRGQVLLLAFVTFFGWYYEHTRLNTAAEVVDAYTELERTNGALRMSQAHVRQIAENIGQALWLHDLRTQRVVYANDAFDGVFGLPRTELATDASAWRRHVHPDDVEAVTVPTDYRDRVYRLNVNGVDKWIRHSVYRVGDDQTPHQRAIHLAADITLEQTAASLRERYLETVLEVQENERRHLARELHDDSGQSLTALLVGLRAMANAMGDPSHRELALEMADQLRGVVGDLGRLARGLHPSALDELGLLAAVRRLLDDARAAHGITINLRVSGQELESLLSPNERLTIYRVLQEALTNVARHAAAQTVDVTMTIGAHVVEVDVEDDGQGFDPAQPSSRHELSSGLGLVSMKERAILMGGEVVIESAPGRGTTVQATIPVGRRRAESPDAA